MLIIDYSQLVISSYMALAFSNKEMQTDPDLDMVRHVSLDGIRLINAKFRRMYGEPVLAIDSPKGSWRKQVFPYYKANRKTSKEKSTINWGILLQQVNTIKEEIKEVFPYKVIEVDNAEADDIIGVLTRKCISENTEVMIVSGDRDFIQLQINTDLVQQWDKRLSKYVGGDDPKRYFFEHVVKGDAGDGIPNILSPGDSYVTRTRQKPVTQKRLDSLWEDKSQLKENPRFWENLKVIDLNNTPIVMQADIINAFNEYKTPTRNNMKEYFIAKRMKKLYENINDF
jgi:hypothetical protein